MRLMMNLFIEPGMLPDLTRFLLYETRGDPWKFDLKSAFIGAAIMFVVALFAYFLRNDIEAILKKMVAPIATWQKRNRASQEETYLTSLIAQVRTHLSYSTKDAPADFQPPQFVIPTPLPSSLADAAKPVDPVQIPFASLLDGHNKLIINGDFASGRTRSLVTLVQNIAAKFSDSGELERLPIWLDLLHFTVPEGESVKAKREMVGLLAQKTMPGVNPKWLSQTMNKRPVLVLLENWDRLSAEKRTAVAAWLESLIDQAVDAFWIVTSERAGYGPLTELRFVPLTLYPNTSSNAIYKLYTSWINEIGIQRNLEDDVADAFDWVAKAGASLEEITSRIILYIKTEDVPDSPGAVAEQLLYTHLPIDGTNTDLAATWDYAQKASIDVLTHIAGESVLNEAQFTRHAMAQLINDQLPPKDDRPPKLESAIRKLLQNCKLLQREGKFWTITPGYWRDYLLARYLIQDEHGLAHIEAHLDDISWQRIIEFYASSIDISILLEPVLNYANATSSLEVLNKLVRIALISPPEFALRNDIIKAIAALFMDPGLSKDERFLLGQSLAQIAGAGARAFFLQTLRSPSLQVRCAALRGIGWCGIPQDLKILAAALKHKNEDIQLSSIYGMRDLGTPGATTFLSKALSYINENLMAKICTALADMPGGDKILEDLVYQDDLMLRRSATYGLARLASKRQTWAYDKLVRLAREDSEWLVRSAAESLVAEVDEVQSKEVVVSAPPKVDEIDWLMAWAARQNLGLGVGDAAMDMLIKAAQQGNSDVKILAAKTFAQIGHKEHQEILTRLTQDSDPLVAQIAGDCLQELETRYRYPAEVKPVVIEEPEQTPQGDSDGDEEPELFSDSYTQEGFEDAQSEEHQPEAVTADEEPSPPDSANSVFI